MRNGETFTLDLSRFYVAQNKILTKSFLKWQLKMKYNMELNDSYEIHIIDMNIKSLTIKGHQYIELFQIRPDLSNQFHHLHSRSIYYYLQELHLGEQ